jgi:Mg2+/Co2+ transporter CorB
MSDDILISSAITLLLLVFSAFFSGSETSLTTTSRARLHELERRGSKRAVLVRELASMRERLIGTVLLGKNLANVAASAFATSLLLRMFGDLGLLYVTLSMTILIFVFGEVLPKTYALIIANRAALAVAPLMKPLVTLLSPVVIAVEFAVKKSLGLFGVDVTRADNVLSAHEELRGAIALHHRQGSVVKKDRDMLGGILDLQELTVRDVMVHRTKMVMVDRSEPTDSIIEAALRSGHSRIPVSRDKPENIIGVLHAKDLLKELHRHGGDTAKIDLEDIISPPWFVPDTRPVADQLNAFLRRKTHFALVVDEYGEVMGLVTLEDIIEEIVGDIADEHDIAVSGVRPQPGGAFIVDGIVPVRDLNRLNDWDLPDDEVTTVAGLVIHEAQMIPEVGQAFTFHGFRFEVLHKRRHQITSLRISPVKKHKMAPHNSLNARA